jgi:hypothetical protein
MNPDQAGGPIPQSETLQTPEKQKSKVLSKITSSLSPLLNVLKKKEKTEQTNSKTQKPKGLIQTGVGIGASVAFGGLSMMSNNQINDLNVQQNAIINKQADAQVQMESNKTTVSQAAAKLQAFQGSSTASKIARYQNPELSQNLASARAKYDKMDQDMKDFLNLPINRTAFQSRSEVIIMPGQEPKGIEIDIIDKAMQLQEYIDTTNIAKQQLQVKINTLEQDIANIKPVDVNILTANDLIPIIQQAETHSGTEAEDIILLKIAIQDLKKSTDQLNQSNLGLTQANSLSAPSLEQTKSQKTTERNIEAGIAAGGGLMALTGIFRSFGRGRKKEVINETDTDTESEPIENLSEVPPEVENMELLPPATNNTIVGPQLTKQLYFKDVTELIQNLENFKYPIKMQQAILNDFANSKLITRSIMVTKGLEKAQSKVNSAIQKTKNLFGAFRQKIDNYVASSERVMDAENSEVTGLQEPEQIAQSDNQGFESKFRSGVNRAINKFNSLPVPRIQQIGAAAVSAALVGLSQVNTMNMQKTYDGMYTDTQAEMVRVGEFKELAKQNAKSLEEFTQNNQTLVNNIPHLSMSQVIDIMKSNGADTSKLMKGNPGDQYIKLEPGQEEYVRLVHQVIIDNMELGAQGIGGDGREGDQVSYKFRDLSDRMGRESTPLQKLIDESRSNTSGYLAAAIATNIGAQIYAMYTGRRKNEKEPESSE